MRDPYEVLGVSRHATDEDIKSAFRRQAAKHHPDRNPNDPDAAVRFKELNQANQILTDPEKRAAYDRWGAAAFTPGGAGPPGSSFDLSNLDGFLGDILGAMGLRAGGRGELRQRLVVSFEEAARGCSKELTYSRVDLCGHCEGTGAAPGTATGPCPACRGRGRVRSHGGLFPISAERFCGRCHGTGRIATTPCRACRARGLLEQQHQVRLDIPAGIQSGSTRVVPKGGSRTRPQGSPGDLTVTVEVEKHPFFHRVNDDIVCKVPITFTQAALGGEVEVPTLDGKLKLRIPPGTQPDSTLRLRGKGVPHRVRSGRGDQLIEVTVEIPIRVSDHARELIEELGKELGEDVLPQRTTFLERLRGWFG